MNSVDPLDTGCENWTAFWENASNGIEDDAEDIEPKGSVGDDGLSKAGFEKSANGVGWPPNGGCVGF